MQRILNMWPKCFCFFFKSSLLILCGRALLQNNSTKCDCSRLPISVSQSIKYKSYLATVVLLSEDISASPLCPCNYFWERICFNMSSVNEPWQGMLQASSSWLTCIWHNVPCADRCRVAVCSSGFCHCKRIRHDWWKSWQHELWKSH